MSEPRSPRDRLRAIRAGRVSQLLSSSPDDGLPPIEPPRLKLNGRPVTTGAAFDAVMARAHGLKVDAALDAVIAKTGHRLPKDRPTYPTGTPPINPLAVQMYQAALKAASTAAISANSPLYDGLDDPMARQREDQAIRRAISDELADLTHLLRLAPSNDNQRLAPYLPVELDTTLRPQPANPPELPRSHPGPLIDDPEIEELGQAPPLPGETTQALDPLPPKDWDEFNQPQIESIPIIEIDIEQYILKHNSSPETQEDTRYVLESFKREFRRRGIVVVDMERETELYIPNLIDGTRTGSRFADLGLFIIFNGELLRVPRNVVDVLVDGITPTARERRARDGANRNLPWLPGWYAQLDTLPKSRGMVRSDWQTKIDAIASDQVDYLLELLVNEILNPP